MNSYAKKILLCWEFGGNHGHIAKLIPISKELLRRGHSICFAVKDPESLVRYAPFSEQEKSRVEIIKAPQIEYLNGQGSPQMSVPEILFYRGFGAMYMLAPVLNRWREILDTVEPDIVMCDYSPGVQVALRSKKYSHVRFFFIGGSFWLFPSSEPSEDFSFARKEHKNRIVDVADAIVKVVNALSKDFDLKPISHFGELFKADHIFVTSIPELDLYSRNTDDISYIGAIGYMPDSDIFRYSDNSLPKIFCYLRPANRILFSVLKALRSKEVQACVYAPQLTSQDVIRFSNERMTIKTKPLNLAHLLKHCDLVIHHGGAGLLCDSLQNGIPNLIAPTQLEQNMNAAKLVESGLGLTLGAGDNPLSIKSKVIRILEDEKFYQRAENLAKSYRDLTAVKSVALVCDRILG